MVVTVDDDSTVFPCAGDSFRCFAQTSSLAVLPVGFGVLVGMPPLPPADALASLGETLFAFAARSGESIKMVFI